MNWELVATLTGLMLFSYWFNYVAGGPLSDDPKKVDVRAILFAIPFSLSIRRLKKEHMLAEIREAQTQDRAMTRDMKTLNGLKLDQRRDLYLAGREFFTWERSLLCAVCFHWWITVLAAIIFLSQDLLHAREDFFLAAFTYLVNHLLIRKIS